MLKGRCRFILCMDHLFDRFLRRQGAKIQAHWQLSPSIEACWVHKADYQLLGCSSPRYETLPIILPIFSAWILSQFGFTERSLSFPKRTSYNLRVCWVPRWLQRNSTLKNYRHRSRCCLKQGLHTFLPGQRLLHMHERMSLSQYLVGR
jgi:hypothetical protein